MSAGLFPLLSDIPPFERLVAASGVGLNVNFADPEAAAASFAERWQNVAANYSSIRQRSIAAAARYGWENVVNLYRSLYDDVLGARYRTILDVPVFAGTRDEAVQQIDAAYASGKPTIVVFANANTLNVASRDERYRSVLKHCLVMNDGIGIDTASRILFGSHFPQNLNGTDFTPTTLSKRRTATASSFSVPPRASPNAQLPG